MEGLLAFLLPILALAFPEAAIPIGIAIKLLPYAPVAIAAIEEAVRLGESAYAALEKNHPAIADAVKQIAKRLYANVTPANLDHTTLSIFAPQHLTQEEENSLADKIGDPRLIG